ncbi:AraC family transcriptional regulator [Muricauda sp. 2012CJ35-5]|uniref:AraC family transcriptional regulator n=1 Tax=Flagellimonas spongiicola TaxID=2942208 RepID=A0ABT0PRJ9_9FLAO|nr:AraC family transcriptional regulator [Allomuricauda spongiicola]MCL6273831.1 AraC family transcriptional regulator [Allomuricauda spongiicola]
MQTRKPYLSQELRLDDIAELLNISRHHASQVINENYGLNFFDYVNAYRVEEAKRLLEGNQENDVQSISEVAYQSGFNNRVSFYNAFKKVTNTTPTEYLQAKIPSINPIFTAKKT